MMKKKLMSGGVYTRAEYLQFIESGKVLTVEKAWSVDEARQPTLGEDLVRNHYLVETQGSAELESLQLQIQALQEQSVVNQHHQDRLKNARTLMKKKFETINEWLIHKDDRDNRDRDEDEDHSALIEDEEDEEYDEEYEA